MIILFSLMTPLGMLLGAGLDHYLNVNSGHLTEALFNAIASGTFLYIATLDDIHMSGHEHDVKKHLFFKVSYLAAGLVLMAIVAIWV